MYAHKIVYKDINTEVESNMNCKKWTEKQN